MYIEMLSFYKRFNFTFFRSQENTFFCCRDVLLLDGQQQTKSLTLEAPISMKDAIEENRGKPGETVHRLGDREKTVKTERLPVNQGELRGLVYKSYSKLSSCAL